MSRLNARIMKVTGLFGGLQVTNILCSIVRTKLVALWIGAVGMGLFGLFNSALELIYSISQLGIRQSAVRDMASASTAQIPRIAWSIRRWSIALGFVGAILTLIFSRWLSQISFGDSSYQWAFACFSILVFLSAVSQGEGAIFQGLQRFRKLAVCSMIGAVGGLAISVPMFYFWGIKSIVPSIIAYGVITWLAMGYYRETVPKPEGGLCVTQTIALGKHFMTLGIYMTITAVVTNVISYGFMAYLNNYADIAVTGYYNAGFTLINRYVGLVFTAISMEYFPRLAAVSHSKMRTSTFASNQIYLSLAVIVPVALTFMALAVPVIHLLYTRDFIVILPFIIWAMVGTVLRAISWCMAYVIVSRGDGKIFLATEILSCAISITLNVLCYNLWGMSGLGYAYLIWYAAYVAIIAYVYYHRYHLFTNRQLPIYVLYSTFITIIGAVLAIFLSPLALIPLIVISLFVSFRTLRRHLPHRK